jgi:hypothetical protein
VIRILSRFWPERAGLRIASAGLGVGALLGTAALGSSLVHPTAVEALELRGRTYFTAPPVKVIFRNYYSNTWESGGEYYFTVPLPAGAGEALGALQIQQVRGVDRSFGFLVERSRAFQGEPRREGPPVPVEVQFDPATRLFEIRFPQPVAPGQTVTLALRPQRNPGQADTYLFAVTAFPAGPEPEATPVGFARMPIYDPWPY